MPWEKTFEQTQPPPFGLGDISTPVLAVAGLILIPLVFPLGMLTLAAAIGVQALSWYLSINQRIICKPEGFSIISTSRRAGTKKADYSWTDITCTCYRESAYRSQNSLRRIGYFAVEVRGQRAFEVSERMQEFHSLIDLFNRMTPHLPYIWRRQQGFTLSLHPDDAGSDRYRQIERRAAA